jgi:hypothetical protein
VVRASDLRFPDRGELAAGKMYFSIQSGVPWYFGNH